MSGLGIGLLCHLLGGLKPMDDLCKVTTPSPVAPVPVIADTAPAADTVSAALNNDVKQTTFPLWAKRSKNASEFFYQLEYGDEVTRKEAFPLYYMYMFVVFPNAGESTTEDWMIKVKDSVGRHGYSTLIVDYKGLAGTDAEALGNMETIANYTAVYLEWIVGSYIKEKGSNPTVRVLGFDMGAIIAGRTAEIIKINGKIGRPSQLIVLDPYIPDSSDLATQRLGYQFPKLDKTVANVVYVYHTSTCSHTPVIPACVGSSNDTMGISDYVFNGGAIQPGCSAVDEKCSKNRVMDIFLDMMSRTCCNFSDPNTFWGVQCNSLDDFNNGRCNETCDSYIMKQVRCRIIYAFDYTGDGRFYVKTNAELPYGRGRNYKEGP